MVPIIVKKMAPIWLRVKLEASRPIPGRRLPSPELA